MSAYSNFRTHLELCNEQLYPNTDDLEHHFDYKLPGVSCKDAIKDVIQYYKTALELSLALEKEIEEITDR